MKTPQEAAREYATKKCPYYVESDCDASGDSCNRHCQWFPVSDWTERANTFLAGDAFGYRRGMEKAYRWISVKDELPKDQDDVLVLFCNGRKGVGSYVGNNEWAVVIANEYDSHDLKVLAWRPIERVNK